MDSVGVVVPLRVGGKKMKKRRELDALVAQSLAKRACNAKRQAGNGINSQDQLLSQSTDDQDDSNWTKVQVSRTKTKSYPFLRTCGPLAFLTSIFILFGFMYWLYFDLRQQIYEHRMKIEEVSASSQFIPNALQRWHEVAKLLEHNQTTVNNKLLEVQFRMDNFEKELSEIIQNINKKDVDSEKEKLIVLQTSVGNFGAKIQDLSIDVELLKENFNKLRSSEDENKTNLTKILTKLNFIMTNYSSPAISSSNEKFKIVLNNMSQVLSDEFRNLSAQVSIINDTLSQKTKDLEDEFAAQKPKFDNIIENFANISSHVTSIEDDWSTVKQKAFKLEDTTLKFNAELNFLKNNSERLTMTVNEIQNEQRRRQPIDHRAQLGRGIQSTIFQIKRNLTNPKPIFLNDGNVKKNSFNNTQVNISSITTILPSTIPPTTIYMAAVSTSNSKPNEEKPLK